MTTSVADLVRDLESLGVRFEFANGRLRIHAPKDVLTDDLLQRLRGHRDEIIALLGDRWPGWETGKVMPARQSGRDRALPLSFAQQRLWFLDQLDPGPSEYYLPLLIWWRGPFDVEVLGAALSGVVARHEVLRTRLVEDADGVACQVVDPPGPFVLSVADVSGDPDLLGAVGRLLAADAVMAFDLAGGPLVRGLLVRLSADRHVVLLAMHHVVSDEWSGRILRREVSALYEALLDGRPDPLPPLAVQYADFAVWQREHLAGAVLDGQLEYWREQLAGLPELDLPVDRPRPAV